MSGENHVPLQPGQGTTRPSIKIDSLKEFLNHAATIASSPNDVASAILDEIDLQQKEIRAKDEQLANNRVTIKGMYAFYMEEKDERNKLAAKLDIKQKEIDEKNEALTEHSKRAESLQREVEELQSAKSQEEYKVTQKTKEINDLRKTLNDQKKTIDQMNEVKSGLGIKLSSEKKRNEGLEKEMSLLNQKLQAAQARLQKLESFTLKHSEVGEDSMLDSFSNLWDYATTEIFNTLKEDLSAKALNERETWANLRSASDHALQYHVPLPASNSSAAKGMRLVAILAILSREINRQIFQPTYILSEDAPIRDILNRLAEANDEKESFCRSMLLAIEPGSQKMSLQSRVQAVVEKVPSTLYELLSETKGDELRQSIRNIVLRAIDIWRPIQRAQQRYEPDFESDKGKDEEWYPFHFPGGNSTENEVDPNIQDENPLIVFPRISLVKNGERVPLTFDIQLRRSQKLYIDAEEDLNRPSTKRTVGRVSSNRSRRKPKSSNTARLKREPFLENNTEGEWLSGPVSKHSSVL